jgi:hypothetical protein
MPLTRK